MPLLPVLLAASVAASDPAMLWDRYCLACHGAGGGGDGPGAGLVWPRPRDLTKGRMKWRTTASGSPATPADLARTIRRGAAGTAMPAFERILSDAQVASLVAYVQDFAPAPKRPPKGVSLPPRPSVLDVARGREKYVALCLPCHGDAGAGDGPAAATLVDDAGKPAKPHPLSAPRRPREDGGDRIAPVALTLATGLDGTPMPSFVGALPGDELWHVAAYVASLEKPRAEVPARELDPGLPRGPSPLGFTIAPQGAPPPSLPPAAASLSSAQCGRCHARQRADWGDTIHARAASPGLIGQYPLMTPDAAKGCQRCHAPLAEQLGAVPLRDEGITCAACHVRGHVRRGPPRGADSRLLALPSYPLELDVAYERADFCMPCHQLPTNTAVAGKPLLDTYREWLRGPYMPRGVQCQHCHMPERAHTWKGVHDPETMRQGIALTVAARRAGGRLAVDATLANVGAGHMLPTTPTPALWIVVELLDGGGEVVGRGQRRVGRHLRYETKGWRELEDTRVRPGGALTYTPAWDETAIRRATRVRVSVRVVPDDYYIGFYRQLLRRRPNALLQAALERAVAAEYVATTRELVLSH